MLNILPNETLYSYLVRICSVSGYPSVICAVNQFIGTTNKQWLSHFPSFIPQISETSALPSHKLLLEHTAFPIYRSFLPLQIAKKVEAQLINGSASSLESIMSLAANRLKRDEKVRYCPICAQQDKQKYAWEYWHATHQLPGSFACTKHQCKLKELEISRKKYVLPPTHEVQVSSANEKELKLANLTERFFNESNFTFCSSTINLAYKCRLLELNLSTNKKTYRIKAKQWQALINEYWKPINEFPQVSEILNKNEGWQYPINVIYSPNTVFHPIKHLLIIGFLYNSFDDFLTHYISVKAGETSLPAAQIETSKANNHNQDKNIEILELLKEGNSLRAVASHCHMSVNYVKKVAQINNLPIKRRTQFINNEMRRAIWRKLFIGESTNSIAKEMRLSTGAVEQLLSCQPQIVKLRQLIRLFKKRQEQREILLKAAKKLSTRNEIRKSYSSTYIWLFKNDKGWLYEHLPKARPQTKTQEKTAK